MKEIQKFVQKLSREQESAAAAAAAAPAAAYELVQKHEVTPGIPGWLNEYLYQINFGKRCNTTIVRQVNSIQIHAYAMNIPTYFIQNIGSY